MQATMTNAVDQMDRWGKPAWIALMVVSFILFWPIGLALLAYLIWSGRMGCNHKRWGSWKSQHHVMGSTGNRAFDDYREETLKRLEEEAREFKDFVERLKFAKDKEEFDRFMSERRSRPDSQGPQPNAA
ncbi:MAG: DUF2852 domain-containing protein [Hyphomicrobiaceae bacterium]